MEKVVLVVAVLLCHTSTVHGQWGTRVDDALVSMYTFSEGTLSSDPDSVTQAEDTVSTPKSLGTLTINTSQGVSWRGDRAGVVVDDLLTNNPIYSSATFSDDLKAKIAASEAFTLEFWASLSFLAPPFGRPLFSLGRSSTTNPVPDDASLFVKVLKNAGNRVEFGVKDSASTTTTVSASTGLPDETPAVHMAFVMYFSDTNEYTLRVYLNGGQIGAALGFASPTGFTDNWADDVFYFGDSFDHEVVGEQVGLNGSIYMAAIHDRRLVTTELVENFNSGLPPSVPTVPALTVVVLNEDTAVDFTLPEGGDPNGEGLTYDIVSLPGNGALSRAGMLLTPPLPIAVPAGSRTLTFTPVTDENGDGYSSFGYRVFDGTAYSRTGTVQFNVAPVNDPPVAQPASANGYRGDNVTVALTASDIDSNVSCAVAVISNLPAYGTLFQTNGTAILSVPMEVSSNSDGICARVIYGVPVSAPGASYVGPTSFTDTFQFKVKDPEGLESLAPATATITANNDVQAETTTATCVEEESVTITLQGSRSRALSWQARILSTPVDGRLYLPSDVLFDVPLVAPYDLPIDSPDVVFVPDKDVIGDVIFTFTAVAPESGVTGGSTAVTVTVTNVNDPPVVRLLNGTFTVASGESIPVSAFVVEDPDLPTDIVRCDLSASNGGAVAVNGGASATGLTFERGTGELASNIIFSGTVADINTALAPVTFVGGSEGINVITVQITDGAFSPVSNSTEVNVTAGVIIDQPDAGEIQTTESEAANPALWVVASAFPLVCCCLLIAVLAVKFRSADGDVEKGSQAPKLRRTGRSKVDSLDQLLFENDGALVNTLVECDSSADMAIALVYLFDGANNGPRLLASRLTYERKQPFTNSDFSAKLFYTYSRMLGGEFINAALGNWLDDMQANSSKLPSTTSEYSGAALVGGPNSLDKAVTKLFQGVNAAAQNFPAPLAEACKLINKNLPRPESSQMMRSLVVTEFLKAAIDHPEHYGLIEESAITPKVKLRLSLVGELLFRVGNGGDFPRSDPMAELNPCVYDCSAAASVFVDNISKANFKGRPSVVKPPSRGIDESISFIQRSLKEKKKTVVDKVCESSLYEAIMNVVNEFDREAVIRKDTTGDQDEDGVELREVQLDTRSPPPPPSSSPSPSPSPSPAIRPKCPSCQAIVQPDWKACAFCATAIGVAPEAKPADDTCKSCSMALRPGWKGCPSCGTPR